MRGNSPKNNLRSFRYSDEVAAILEAQEGNSLNEKFETLVLFCYYKVESRKKDLEEVERRIKHEQERLYNLYRATEELRMLESDIQNVKRSFAIVQRRAAAIAEKIEKDGLA